MMECEKFVEFFWLWLRLWYLCYILWYVKVVGCNVYVDSLDKLVKVKVRKKLLFFFLR